MMKHTVFCSSRDERKQIEVRNIIRTRTKSVIKLYMNIYEYVVYEEDEEKSVNAYARVYVRFSMVIIILAQLTNTISQRLSRYYTSHNHARYYYYHPLLLSSLSLSF